MSEMKIPSKCLSRRRVRRTAEPITRRYIYCGYRLFATSHVIVSAGTQPSHCNGIVFSYGNTLIPVSLTHEHRPVLFFSGYASARSIRSFSASRSSVERNAASTELCRSCRSSSGVMPSFRRYANSRAMVVWDTVILSVFTVTRSPRRRSCRIG